MTSGGFSWCMMKVPSSGFCASLWNAGATAAAGAAAARQTPTEAPPALRELSFDVREHFFLPQCQPEQSPFPFFSFPIPTLCWQCFWEYFILHCSPYSVTHRDLQTPEMTGSMRGGGTEMQVQAVKMWHLLKEMLTAISRSSQNSSIHSSQWNLQNKNAQTDFAPVLLT